MKTKQTTILALALAPLLIGMAVFFAPQAAAVGNNGCETDTSIIKCTDVNESGEIKKTGAWSLLVLAINIMTAGIGILAVAGIVYGSVLYASAGGSAEQTKKAMGIITNVVIGILAYGFMFAILNFIIPGGLFG